MLKLERYDAELEDLDFGTTCWPGGPTSTVLDSKTSRQGQSPAETPLRWRCPQRRELGTNCPR